MVRWCGVLSLDDNLIRHILLLQVYVLSSIFFVDSQQLFNSIVFFVECKQMTNKADKIDITVSGSDYQFLLDSKQREIELLKQQIKALETQGES